MFTQVTYQGTLSTCSTALQLSSSTVMHVEKLADQVGINIPGNGIQHYRRSPITPTPAKPQPPSAKPCSVRSHGKPHVSTPLRPKSTYANLDRAIYNHR
ncbi:MAG: hypothetical protein MUF49_29370 [Oculatellaceae cyanobacterium Prado106]|nr:hypothetical protein [Oculatellaceae cyanobacterium Prado106]